MDFNEKYMHKYTYSYIEPNSVNLFAHMQAHKNSQNLSLNNIRHPHHTNVRISYINSNSLEKKEIYHPNNTNPNHHNIYANVNIQGLTKNVFTHNINLSLNDKRMNSVGDGVNEN
jgi:hypothetical protein